MCKFGFEDLAASYAERVSSSGNTLELPFSGCFNATEGIYYYYYYWYSALGPVLAETRVLSGDWYSSGTLHPQQVLRGSLPLLSPAFFRRSHFSPPGASTSATTREIPAAEVGTVGENVVQ